MPATNRRSAALVATENVAPASRIYTSRSTDRTAAPSSRGDGLGAVYTRRWAAEFVLDLGGYTADRDLAASRAIEPACGHGAFLVPMVERLATSCAAHGRDLGDAGDAIRAWDLDPTAVAGSRAVVCDLLLARGLDERTARLLAKKWIEHGDFLLDFPAQADWVVGNPPYVRLEDVPPERSTAYRDRWNAMTGRADVYIGFYQAGLEALQAGGALSYLCADRWMTAQYGRVLRKLIEDRFALEAVVTLHDADVFHQPVAAYPAVVTIRATVPQGPVLRVEGDRTFGPRSATAVAALHQERIGGSCDTSATPIADAVSPRLQSSWTLPRKVGGHGWATGRPDRIALVETLEARFPSLGDDAAGVRIGVGITTGADAVYLTRDTEAVEPDRLLPVAMANDLVETRVEWAGTHLINPWHQSGELVDLDSHPRLGGYLRSHETRLRSRHVAKRRPDRWHRTIDRPVTGLDSAPKLLMADLRPRVTPVLDHGAFYPHHNLIWLTSTDWDLEVLGGLLLSDFATLFVETYSPRMSGNALRVTPQYLRRVRIPLQASLSPHLRRRLVQAFRSGDTVAATHAAFEAYRVERPPGPLTGR